MNIAIVGTSANLSCNQQKNMRKYITIVLDRYDIKNDVIITDGTKGFDSIALQVAKELGLQTNVFHPKKQEWKHFKERNLKITSQCDTINSSQNPTIHQK